VFGRQWTHWKNADEMKCRSKLAAMLDNDASPRKRLPSFNEVIVRCQGMLEKIMSSLSRPFLVDLAQQVCEKVETKNASEQQLSSSAVQHSPLKSVIKSSPAKHSVPQHSNLTCVVEVNRLSGKDEQKSNTAESPAKQSKQSTVAVDSASEGRKTVDNVSPSKSAVRPSTSAAINNESDKDSDADSVDIYDDDWFRPSTKRAKKSGIKKPWSSLEEELVYKGVKQYGIGNWALIHANYLQHRTNIDIKDKWRTMLRQGRLRELARQFGPLPLP